MRPVRAWVVVAVLAALVAVRIGLATYAFVGGVERVPHLMFASVCLWWAAVALSPGSATRRGWAFLGTMPVFAIGGDVALAAGATLGELPVSPAIVIGANTVWIYGLALLVHGVKTTGLVLPRTRAWTAATGVAIAVAVALSYVPVASVAEAGVPDGVAEWTWAIRRVYGAVADIVVIGLAMEVLRCVAPMGAGVIARPYVFIATAAFLFLCVTIAMVLSSAISPVGLPLLAKALETAAWGLLGVAGISQGRIARP